MSIITTAKAQPFDKDHIYEYIKTFNFPRLAGTEGEKRAVDLSIETFKNIGFEKNQIIKQRFKFSNFYSEKLIKIFVLMNLIFIVIVFIIKYIYTFLTIAIIGIFILIFLLMIKLLRYPEFNKFWVKHFGTFYQATNVFVRVPSKKAKPERSGDIIISAHLDSKSQTFKTIWRVIFSRSWLFGDIGLLILYTFFLVDYHNLANFKPILIIIEIGIIISTCLVIFSNIYLLFLKTDNKSPGSLDNASGMAIVFELSSFFRKNPLDNYNLWFCQFSAEERGTMGSRNFLDIYEKEFLKDSTFQFNFDMVSMAESKKNQVEYIKSYGIFPRKKISLKLSKYIHEAAIEENIELRDFHVSVGAHTDSLAFHLRKFDSIDFTTRAAAIFTHSENDTPEKVDPQILLETCLIVLKSILFLNKDFNKLSNN
ncbi:MAG: M28 family peptidase [Candidatus Lokiarchaeota archaeon]|nr:M28 family peptidase [Candidatus Lokiarchaeota archaeon]